MAEQERNVDTLVVPRAGRVEGVTDGLVPYRVVDADGVELAAVTEFLRDLSASDCSPSTLRSYAYELLGWLRFLQAVAVPWDRADCAGAAAYVLGRRTADEPVYGNHWEYEYYFRNVPGGWHLWPVPRPVPELDAATRAWVVFTSRPLPDALPLPPGWRVMQAWEFRETRVLLLERDAPPPV